MFALLEQRRAVVTGSSSGIGKAIACQLASAGAEVVVHGGTSTPRAERVAAAIRRLGGHAHVIVEPLESAEGRARLVDRVAQLWTEPPDIWVNNAGADLLTGKNARLPFDEKLSRLLDVDIRATLALSRQIGQRMRDRGSGVILNIGWDQAATGMEGDSGELFAAAKNAIMGFTRSLALSLAPQVRVNCIAPGWIRTAWGETAGDEWQQRVLRETPLRRWGEPEDIARLARFLVSDEASYLTGQVINANGGAVR
jgi:3-oxoacyl-[acyl-carrier protein] reductase